MSERTPPERVHGTPDGYGNWKCRCDRCREAWRIYLRERGYVRNYMRRVRGTLPENYKLP